MATLLSVGAESALLCLLQTHSSLQEDTWDRDCTTTCSPCSACWWPSTATTAASTGVSSAAQNQTQITVFHTPTDVHVTQCRTLGFICTLAGWKLSHSIEFYVGFALLPKAQSCLSYKSEELLLQHYVFALSQLRDKVSPLVLAFVFQTWGLSHALLI